MDPRAARRRALELRLEAASADRPVPFHGLTMLPLLQEGDEVVLEPVNPEELRVGDIVTYRHGERFPTRRIVAVDRGKATVLIRGDSMPNRDFQVPTDEVLGRAVARRRGTSWCTERDPAWRRQRRAVLWRDRLAALPAPRPLRRAAALLLPWPDRSRRRQRYARLAPPAP